MYRVELKERVKDVFTLMMEHGQEIFAIYLYKDLHISLFVIAEILFCEVDLLFGHVIVAVS